jgi:hypothetical protein
MPDENAAMEGCMRNCIVRRNDPKNCFLYEIDLSLSLTLDTACLVGLHSINFVSICVLSFWAVTVTGCKSASDDSLAMRDVDSCDVPVADVSLLTVGGS